MLHGCIKSEGMRRGAKIKWNSLASHFGSIKTMIYSELGCISVPFEGIEAKSPELSYTRVYS